MLRLNLSVFILPLLYQIAVGTLNKTALDGYEDVEHIAKELEKKFPFVRHGENFTEYLKFKRINIRQVSYYDRRSRIPVFFDWRDRKMVSPIKNQQQCAACWAFSTVAALESHLKIYTSQGILLSEQFLIDCIKDGDGPHCGHYSLLKTYGKIVAEFGGVLRQGDYRPYSADFRDCSYSKPPPSPVPVIGFVRVRSNEDAMAEQLYTQGPLSAAINSASMAKYRGNYIDEPTEEQCSSRPEKMDHAILIVGYNVYQDNNGKTVPYWIVKNSWGENWGDHGFYYIVRGRNACGIANDVSFPVVAK